MGILEEIQKPQVWQEFLAYKIEKQHLSEKEEMKWRRFLGTEAWRSLTKIIGRADFIPPLPVKRSINKGSSGKKRIVYSYPEEFGRVLKLIAFLLYRYDFVFSENCYAFRRNFGARHAIRRICSMDAGKKYCLKVDISNYFNSINERLLLEKLVFLQQHDAGLYELFEKLLLAGQAVWESETVTEQRGAMAGTPISPFWANVYLKDTDAFFQKAGVAYFRYSDDILIFADSMEELEEYRELLYRQIASLGLSLNPEKVHLSLPGEGWEFLGFGYRDGQIDLSENTIQKMKRKIKRKSHTLRRWQQKKGLDGEKAAKGFLRAMNYKFFAVDSSTDFCWSRWFFPNLTTDRGLRILDEYMQQYIRYTVTGRHYKGNYRITYAQMKEWGYRSLVHEYYLWRDKTSGGGEA